MIEHQINEKKLGRGLSALLGENKNKNPANTNLKNTQVVEKIAIEKIIAGIYQPRQFFSQQEIEELAQSIKENGVIQPILLRKKSDEDSYEIIAGERRYRASKLAGLKEIPAIVKKINNHDALEIALIENIQREDLSVIEEARGYKRLIDEFSYLQEMVAQKVGKSRSHVANLLRLLNLPKEVQDFLDKRLLSMGHARAIINAEDPESLAKKIVAESLTVRQAEEVAREEKIEKARNVPVLFRTESKIKFINSDHLNKLENQLSELCGLDVKISYNGFKGSGKITINFSEIEAIQDLIEKMQIN
ncbi:chromosome partitioning protein ParB [Alphaproteobacteria bacterium]|nr:chromosome partitioning protein ParB [Alphaproteobacteria bacterium]